MKLQLLTFAACLAVTPAAFAQTMPAPAPHARPPAAHPQAPVTPPQLAHDMPMHDHSMMPAPAPRAQPAAPPETQHEHMTPTQDEHSDNHASGMQMGGVFGAYPMTRDASGTSWQPDLSSHGGVHRQAGDWMLMGHALMNGVYAWSDGPRGDEKAFVSGMIMGSARRDLGNGDTINLRLMASPDPFMGASGYPLLFAAGETANGQDELVDRQHPHELIMEASASYAHRLDEDRSVFIYAGLPGEPAFGPPAFMHRVTAMDSPEAPLSHHWLDSTHITFGVVTLGYVQGPFKLEASRFRGREPDEDRYDIETGALDSNAVRLSWNPNQRLALQISWADLESPEQLHPDEDEERWSASAIYAQPIGEEGLWTTTLAFGTKAHDGGDWRDAWLLETAYAPNEAWTVFARAEQIETEALVATETEAARLSLGAIRDFRLREHVTFGVGGLVQQHFTSDALESAYGEDPLGAMAFVRLKIG
jgi:hypothetical protein